MCCTKKYLVKNFTDTMFIVPKDEHKISLITSEIKSRTRSCHDELSSDVLLNTINYFLSPLVQITSSITT